MELLFPELYIRHVAQTTDATLAPRDQTDGLVERLAWQNKLQQRTTAVVTISFNTLAALLIIASILFEARKARDRKSAVGAELGFCQIPTQLRHFRWSYPLPSLCKVLYFLECKASGFEARMLTTVGRSLR